MTKWAWEVDEARRPRVIDYLLKPEGAKLAARLCEEVGHPTERMDRDAHARLAVRSRPETEGTLEILIDLGLGPVNRPDDLQPPAPPHSPRKPEAILSALHDLALRERESMIKWYEKSTYPGGLRPVWSSSRPGDDMESRRDWLTLLTLGAMHSMGWYDRGKHKEFLELCDRQGWLDTFAEFPIDRTKWVGVLDEYLEDKVRDMKYHHWMRQFIGIYQLAKCLPSYAGLFLNLTRSDERIRPRASARSAGRFGVSAGPRSSLAPVARARGQFHRSGACSYRGR